MLRVSEMLYASSRVQVEDEKNELHFHFFQIDRKCDYTLGPHLKWLS